MAHHVYCGMNKKTANIQIEANEVKAMVRRGEDILSSRGEQHLAAGGKPNLGDCLQRGKRASSLSENFRTQETFKAGWRCG